MKVWYDACTGKHVRYGAAVAKHLREKGHRVVLTTREHPDTIPLMNFLGEKFHVIGKYDPSSPFSRLRESLKRQLFFCALFEGDRPDAAVSHGSVDLCRTAFGLNIPIICTFDCPRAKAVSRLTLPFVDYLVVSKAIPKTLFEKLVFGEVIQFDGVDEVAWIRSFKPRMRFDYGKPLIVVRQMETKAVYAEGKTDLTERIAKKLTVLGKVVFLSRYERKPREGLIVPEGFIDSASLAAEADLVVSVGGTMAREAALQGTPSLVVPILGYSYVNDYLSKKGFPIFTVKTEKVLEYAKKLVGEKYEVKPLLDKLEDPVEVIGRIVEELES